ncbi:MAG TPA: helix-turn-helix transcriptional regulator [Micromonosporaceae bacterium]|nr:helix-turn-helix transcriptional regulator [Micromonosporaceae bacterium]
MTPPTHTPDLGGLLRGYRRQAGLSQHALAGLSAVSVRAIRDLESGRATRPRPETLRLLADGLRIGESQRAALALAAGSRAVDPAPAAPSRNGEVPAPVDSLVGRRCELDLLTDLVADGERLIAVTGIGGIGKTRLVLELAHRLAAEHDRATLWVPNPSAGWHREFRWVADRALEIVRTRLTWFLVGQLSDIHPLVRPLDRAGTVLFLDGFDDLVALGRPLSTLLQSSVNLQIVLTTRDFRDVSNVQVVPTAPLPVPPPGADHEPSALARVESARLLARHIRCARPAFVLGRANAACVAELCRLADGVPAALQVIGRGALVRPVEQLAAQLRRDPAALEAWRIESGLARSPLESARRAVDALPARTRAVATMLATLDRSWTVAEAAGATGLGADDVIPHVYTMLVAGVARRVDEAEDARFRLLRLARRALDPAGPPVRFASR